MKFHQLNQFAEHQVRGNIDFSIKQVFCHLHRLAFKTLNLLILCFYCNWHFQLHLSLHLSKTLTVLITMHLTFSSVFPCVISFPVRNYTTRKYQYYFPLQRLKAQAYRLTVLGQPCVMKTLRLLSTNDLCSSFSGTKQFTQDLKIR